MSPQDPAALAENRTGWMPRGLCILLLASALLLAITPIRDGDVWWHLVAGKYFLQHGEIPDRDPFLFTVGTDRWIVREWLAQAIFSLVFRLVGPAGLTLFKAALFVLALGLLWRLGTALGCPAPMDALVLLLAAFASRPRLAERPEIFSFVLLAAFLSILVRSLALPPGAEGGRRSGASLPYLVVPLQIIWANLHSSFFLGLVLPWPFLLDAVVLRARRGAGRVPSSRPQLLRHVILAAVALWPASALTPEGLRGLMYPLYLARFPTVGTVDEVLGLPTILGACAPCWEEGIAFFVLALGALILCAILAAAGRGLGPGAWILLAGAVSVPLAVYRLLPYGALLLATVILRALAALSVERPAEGEGGRRPHAAGPAGWLGPWPGRQLLPAGAAALVLVLAGMHGVRGGRFPFGLGVAPGVFPEGAARFVRAANAQGPIFHSFEFGSYLLWSLFPGHRAFIHPDIWHSVSSEAFIARFFRSARDPALFAELARQYDVELLVLPNRLPSWAFVSADPRWALIHWDQVASVYARREGANAALIAGREFRVTRYARDLGYLTVVARDDGLFPVAAAELRRAVREDPENVAAGLSLAFLLKSRGQDLAEALEIIEAAQRLGFRDATLLTWSAEVLAGLGRPVEAEAAALDALRIEPGARVARLVLADLRARAGDRGGAVRHLRDLLDRSDLHPELRRQAEARLKALSPSP